MRKVLGIIVGIILAVYLVWSLFFMKKEEPDMLCQGIELHSRDSLRYDLVTEESILALLDREGLNPTGVPMDSINVALIEQAVEGHPLVLDAECFRTVGGRVKVKVSGRVPLVRVLSSYGLDCYVDSRGEMIDRASCNLNLPVASGYITQTFACETLPSVVLAINEDKFWKNQVEQIYMTREGELQLVPRVGGHMLVLGTADDIPEKLARLRRFYDDGLSVIGWNKYSSVSVAYEGQTVCRNK